MVGGMVDFYICFFVEFELVVVLWEIQCLVVFFVVVKFVIDLNFIEEWMWELVILLVMQFGFGVIGNIIVLVVLVMFFKIYKWWLFYCLVVGLVVMDGGGILLVYFIVMVWYVIDFMYLFLKVFCNYSFFVYIFMLILFVMIVCVMLLDRYVVILYLFFYGLGKNGRWVNVMLCIVWIVGVVIFGFQLVGLGLSFNYYFKFWCFINFVEMNMLDRVNLYIYFIIGILFLLLILGVNIMVIVFVFRNMKLGIKSFKCC